MWKIYLNNIINPETTSPVAFPELHNLSTYSFKINKTYFNKLTIAPNVGIDPIPYNSFFTKYRITALGITVTNGKFSQTLEPGFEMNDTYYKDKKQFTLTYWPDYPELQETQTPLYYWNIEADIIKVCVHYEVIPVHNNFTIPTNNKYWNLTEFITNYAELEKTTINCKTIIENDILNENINPPTDNIVDFFRYLENI